MTRNNAVLINQIKHKSTYLIDDLPAELDGPSIKKVCNTLKQLDTQCFITAINKENILNFLPHEGLSMFHMKQGALIKENN